MTPYVPKPQRGSSVSNGFFRKDEFRYDTERDAFICPAGQVLSTRYESKLRELTKIDYSNRAACLVCAIKSRCTKDYRKVSRLENEAVLDDLEDEITNAHAQNEMTRLLYKVPGISKIIASVIAAASSRHFYFFNWPAKSVYLAIALFFQNLKFCFGRRFSTLPGFRH